MPCLSQKSQIFMLISLWILYSDVFKFVVHFITYCDKNSLLRYKQQVLKLLNLNDDKLVVEDVLKNLANAEIIDYDVEKTNSDYQNEITQTDVKEKFNYTSYLYNYIWYGEFDVDDKQFNKAKSAFINFLKDIKA